MSALAKFGCLVAGLTLVAAAWADEPESAKKSGVRKLPSGKFLRITQDAKGQPLALETAVVRYRTASGEGDLIVDLVSVVHFGERDYYRRLNKQLDGYDAVLYELVAPQGTRIPKGGRSATDSPFAMIHKVASLLFDLELQTERIDYTRKNFIHADLSPKEMAEAIRKRGDDGLTIFLGIAADLLRQQNFAAAKKLRANVKEQNLDLLSLVTDPSAPSKLKRVLAEQLAALETLDGALGRTINTILISDRNQAAMSIFQKELAKGRKKIAIFYGAGHMPDFEKRLRADFGLQAASTEWLRAWDLRVRQRTTEELLLKMLLP